MNPCRRLNHSCGAGECRNFCIRSCKLKINVFVSFTAKKYRGRFYNYVAPLAPNTQLLRPYKASQKLGEGYEVYGVGRKPVYGEIKVNKIDSSCKLKKKHLCFIYHGVTKTQQD